MSVHAHVLEESKRVHTKNVGSQCVICDCDREKVSIRDLAKCFPRKDFSDYCLIGIVRYRCGELPKLSPAYMSCVSLYDELTIIHPHVPTDVDRCLATIRPPQFLSVFLQVTAGPKWCGTVDRVRDVIHEQYDMDKKKWTLAPSL